jgi:hypothetical protein
MERVMQSQETDLLLRIFIGENDHFDGKPLFESIVLKARQQGLVGATVLRGPMGFGHSRRLHTAKFSVFQKIFLLLSRSSILRKKSLLFCRCSMGW